MPAKTAKPAPNTKPAPSIVPPKKPDEPVAITTLEYNGLQAAFSFLNDKLFDGALKNVVILLQRRAHSGGHFSPDRFSRRAGEGEYHEISLNPDGFVGQTDEFIVSILLHEIVHQWQHHFGQKKPRQVQLSRQGVVCENGVVGFDAIQHRHGRRQAHRPADVALYHSGWRL
jgi:hypothetical protein